LLRRRCVVVHRRCVVLRRCVVVVASTRALFFDGSFHLLLMIIIDGNGTPTGLPLVKAGGLWPAEVIVEFRIYSGCRI
jgi:hypothetical protein